MIFYDVSVIRTAFNLKVKGFFYFEDFHLNPGSDKIETGILDPHSALRLILSGVSRVMTVGIES